ncbi:hypothetical protein [Saccharothrix longispora]|uniref:hypothetical protein n=1 Tax=Saccharothrix longispora TaxID=33920 RepID=UPI0028FDA3DE|nr:hypothetical protein [Saccharothrix longispora]MDU0290725.1 hypothetical protein [Saccharothrix longispora]
MALSNIPVLLDGYTLQVTEIPTVKMRIDEQSKQEVPATDREGAQLFTVRLFAKPPAGPTGRRGKGDEIAVTLTTDPGDGFEEGDRVELVDPTVSMWSNDFGAGLSFRAVALVPRARSVAAA